MAGRPLNLLTLEQGSRQQSRLSLQLPAVVTTRAGTRRVTLEELSTRGARFACDRPFRVGEPALLQWDRFEALGEVRWTVGGVCGLIYYNAIPVEHLLATRDLMAAQSEPARSQELDREVIRRTARAFRNGRLRI